jgi:hypothetical protein
MGDPVRLRDDACWRCIIEELRKAHEPALADTLRAALDSPSPQQAFSTFATQNPEYQLTIIPAAETCRFLGRCQE